MTSPDTPHQDPAQNPEGGFQKAEISSDAFIRVQASPEFAELRKTFRGFAFPMTAAFLIWYFAYVLLSVFARDFMSQEVGLGHVNLGHVLGLLQFLTTFIITALYIRHANTRLDPISSKIRAELEGK